MKTKLAVWLLLLNMGCYTPKYTIQGIVMDASSKSPVPEASIETKRGKFITDLEGNFSIVVLKKAKIRVSATGYFALSQGIKLNKQKTNLSIELQPMPLNKVTVKWAGGYATIIDDNGNIKCVPIPEKN